MSEPGKSPRQFSNAFKERVVLRLEGGEKIAAVAITGITGRVEEGRGGVEALGQWLRFPSPLISRRTRSVRPPLRGQDTNCIIWLPRRIYLSVARPQTPAIGPMSECKIACNNDPLRGCFASNNDPL
jgi:hypothetical protein